jgi:hypothetical protein
MLHNSQLQVLSVQSSFLGNVYMLYDCLYVISYMIYASFFGIQEPLDYKKREFSSLGLKFMKILKGFPCLGNGQRESRKPKKRGTKKWPLVERMFRIHAT